MRRYRRQLEMLRDFLSAARAETLKTRVMNRANLNRNSFSHYLKYCLENQLVMPFNGGYAVTPRAEELLHGLDQVLEKEADFRAAVEGLQQTARSGAYRPAPSAITSIGLRRVAFPTLGIEMLTTRWRDRNRERP